MTPLYRLLSGRLPRPLAIAALAFLYAAMLFALLVVSSSGFEDNVYVDVREAR